MTEIERRLAARRRLWDRCVGPLDLTGKRVLDAGTGEGWFTEYLASRGPGEIVSVTCLDREIPPARERLGPLADRVRFRLADLTWMPEIVPESFDVVGADYLVAAVAAYRPYREIDLLKELVRVLKPGGWLVMTGWEATPVPASDAEATIRELFRVREAIEHLVGGTPFREHPSFWVRDRLADLGLPTERIETEPDVHRDFRWFVESARRFLTRLEAGDLRDALTDRLEGYEARLAREPVFEQGLAFGQLYGVVACKLQGAILLGGA